MFAAYFDDSGSHDDSGTSEGSEVVAAAGYVGTPAVWEALEVEWNALLASRNLEYYHSVDCNAQQEQFEGWEIGECNKLHRAFIEIICRHPIIAVGFATPKAPFNEGYHALFAKEQRVEKAAYLHSLIQAWTLLAWFVEWSATSGTAQPNAKVSIVVEDAPKTHAVLAGSYDLAMQGKGFDGLRDRFEGPPTLKPKRGYPQLQAADILAYEMATCMRRLFVPQRKLNRRGSFEVLLAHYYEQVKPTVDRPLLQFNPMGLVPNDAFSSLMPSLKLLFRPSEHE